MKLGIILILFLCLLYSEIYILLFALALLLCFNLLKIWENHDSREELSKEIYENFRYVNSYHRRTAMLRRYYDNLDSDVSYKEYEKKAKQLEEKLPKHLKERLGDIPTRDFMLYYKIKG